MQTATGRHLFLMPTSFPLFSRIGAPQWICRHRGLLMDSLVGLLLLAGTAAAFVLFAVQISAIATDPGQGDAAEERPVNLRRSDAAQVAPLRTTSTLSGQ